MMVERHYDDEALIALIETNRAGLDAHLPSCKPCSEKLQSVRAIAGSLRNAAVWDTRPLRDEPNRTTIANLRAFADRMSYEDTRAETFLRELLDGPREMWIAKLHEHPEWRTAGVVRKLIAAASRAVDTMPPDAVEMTIIATDIADHLDAAAYPSDTVSRLRGAAWQERAYALYYTGGYPDAQRAADRADAAFARCAVDEYDRARLGIVKTLILRAFERIADAEVVARASAATFLTYEDLARSASAGIAEAHLLFSRDEFQRANAVLERLEQKLRDSDLVETHARVLGNLAYCARRMGQMERSLHYYDLSTGLFEALGITTEVTKNRWNAGVILTDVGRLADAERRLDEVVDALDAAGMTSDATLARLDLAQVHLACGRYARVEEICLAAMQDLERAGLAYGQRALTALGLIREASRQRTASPTLVRGVRDYLKRLPSEPNLLFAFAPQ